jgi:polysaccharide biosynthesis protein PslH
MNGTILVRPGTGAPSSRINSCYPLVSWPSVRDEPNRDVIRERSTRDRFAVNAKTQDPRAVQMKRPSRVLYISHASPVPSKIGPSRRHYHMLDQLSRFYEVHLLSLGTERQSEIFDATFADRIAGFDFALTRRKKVTTFVRKVWRTSTSQCDFLPVLEPNLRRLCKQITSSEAFDAIILSIVLLRGLPLPDDVPIVADTHNVEFDVHVRTSVLADTFARRHYAQWQAVSTFREERRCARHVDLLLANSERDRQVFEQQMDLKDVAVIPNGVDITEFSPSKTLGQPGTVLFTGLMSYYPNQQAIKWFLDAVFPLLQKKVPEARLVVAGAAPPAWLTDRRSSVLEVTASVPDMRPYFQRARVVIAPLMIGGGTRVKILEAQAMARPVVSTSLGAEGMEVRNGDSILLADDAESFAVQIARLLRDDEFVAQMGANGRRHVVSNYDWNRIGERLECVLRQRIGLTARDAPEPLTDTNLLRLIDRNVDTTQFPLRA